MKEPQEEDVTRSREEWKKKADRGELEKMGRKTAIPPGREGGEGGIRRLVTRGSKVDMTTLTVKIQRRRSSPETPS